MEKTNLRILNTKTAPCFLLFVLMLIQIKAFAQGNNPIIPDLVADPSIVQFGDTFYCYATTDGYNQGLATSGPPVVWTSKDLVHWSFNGTFFPAAVGQIYWAPSKVVKAKGQYYFYPTVNRNIHVAVADSPLGAFEFVNHGTYATPPLLYDKTAPKGTKGIDAEIFIDDDSKPYLYWAQRGAAPLNDDLVSLDTTKAIVIETKRKGYSEGPIVFKRKGIYYYLYTLSGHENYQYAYGFSKKSPLGPFEFPENDIIAKTDRAKGIYGPGHGNVFTIAKTGKYYFTYLEFGRGSTNRQVWINEITFNADGTIQPIALNREGVSFNLKKEKNIPIKTARTSSVLPNLKIKPIKDSTLNRTETYSPSNAFDGSNGTRWMATNTDSTAWFVADLGAVKKVKQVDIYFVKPTAGHAYRLEYSIDGQSWQPCGGHEDVKIQSPHADTPSVKARFLRLVFLKGTAGLWELEIK